MVADLYVKIVFGAKLAWNGWLNGGQLSYQETAWPSSFLHFDSEMVLFWKNCTVAHNAKAKDADVESHARWASSIFLWKHFQFLHNAEIQFILPV